MAELAEEVEHRMRIRGSRTPSFPTPICSYGYERSRDSQQASGLEPIANGEAVMFDFGAVHGGVVSALVDHVLGGVVYTVIERGYWAATTEFKLNFLAPARQGVLRAEAAIISMSRRTAVVRIDVMNEGRGVAAAQGTVTIVPPRPGS